VSVRGPTVLATGTLRLASVLEEMRIRGLGVIDDAVLELSPGLTVVTGETGAGKTMVLTGLSMLLGGRADSCDQESVGHLSRAGSRSRLTGRWPSARSTPEPSWTTAP
jgi:hypothetical protein